MLILSHGVYVISFSILPKNCFTVEFERWKVRKRKGGYQPKMNSKKPML